MIEKKKKNIFLKLKRAKLYIQEYGVRKCHRGTNFLRRGTQIVSVIAYTATAYYLQSFTGDFYFGQSKSNMLESESKYTKR